MNIQWLGFHKPRIDRPKIKCVWCGQKFELIPEQHPEIPLSIRDTLENIEAEIRGIEHPWRAVWRTVAQMIVLTVTMAAAIWVLGWWVNL